MEKQLQQLLSDFGFKLQGRTLIAKPVGYMPSRVLGTARDAFDACEKLIPLVCDAEFYARSAESPQTRRQRWR